MNIDFTNVPKHYAARTHAEMIDVLMDASAAGPAIHYYMIRGGPKQGNITVWEPGTVGTEYIKTLGHYHVGNLSETYHVVSGTGVLLMQKRLEENGKVVDNRLAEFKAVSVKAGDSIHIPAEYGHLVVNTGTTYLVTVDDSPVYFTPVDTASLPGHADYEPVRRLHGFAYYVIDQGGVPVLRKNPNYLEIVKSDFGGLQVTA